MIKNGSRLENYLELVKEKLNNDISSVRIRDTHSGHTAVSRRKVARLNVAERLHEPVNMKKRNRKGVTLLTSRSYT